MSVLHKKRLLIVSLNFPFPLNNGGAIAQSFFIDGLLPEFDLFIVTSVRNSNIIDEFRLQYPTVTVYNLFDAALWVKPGALFTIKLKLSRAIQKLKGASPKTHDEDHLRSNYITSLVNLKSDRFVTELHAILLSNRIDIVQLEFFETLDLAVSLPDNCVKVYIAHELRTKRIEFAAQYSNTSRSYQSYLGNITALYEYSLLKRCDRVVVFNEEDQTLLLENGVPSFVSPYGIPASLHIRKAPSEVFRKLLFLGGESHFPNKEGLTWFLDNIYSSCNRAVKKPLIVVGEWSPEYRLKYRDQDDVTFLGPQESIYELFNDSILVAPILSGSGLRTKILDAFVNYLPVFCTPFACEGINFVSNQKNCLFTFTDKADFESLLTKDDAELQSLVLSAKHFYDLQFDSKQLVAQRMKVYKSLSKAGAVE